MNEATTPATPPLSLAGDLAKPLLEELATWGPTTTVILHGGSVFEFKGPFPTGSMGHGYYNLKGENGFEGHIGLAAITQVQFQDKLHRGRQSYAFDFKDKDDASVFKVFVGRDSSGELISTQVERFKQIQASGQL